VLERRGPRQRFVPLSPGRRDRAIELLGPRMAGCDGPRELLGPRAPSCEGPLELGSDARQLGLQLARPGLGVSERLGELLRSGLLGRDRAVQLVGALGSSLGLGAQAASALSLLRQLLLQPGGGAERVVSLTE